MIVPVPRYPPSVWGLIQSVYDRTFSASVQHMDQNQNSNSSPENMDSPKAQDPTNVVPTKTKDTPSEGGHYMKIDGIWNLKH